MCCRYALYGLTILLASCSLARINEATSPGSARVTIPLQQDGSPAIQVFAIKSRHGLVVQHVEWSMRSTLTTLSMRGGHYLLEIECERPGAAVVLHGGIDFDISVMPNTAYVLDCEPRPDPKYGYPENNFALTSQAELNSGTP